MKSIKLSIIIDVFFIFFACLFFFYAIFLYNAYGYTASIILSVLSSIIISSVYVIVSAKKGELFFNKQSLEHLIKCFNYKLFLCCKKEVLNLVYNCYKEDGRVDIKENSILLEDKNIEIFPIIKPENITITDIIWAHKQTTKGAKTLIIGVLFNIEILDFINQLNLNITVMETKELYSLLEEKNQLPEIEILPVKNNKKLTLYVKNIFTKKQAKRFLFSGIILTLLSFFSFYPLYYIIFGGLLMTAGVLLRVVKNN